MPFDKDPKGGGTNAGGSKSKIYCSNCYEWERFTQPDWTVEQMQEYVNGKMESLGIPPFLVRLFTKNMPKLERWKKH